MRRLTFFILILLSLNSIAQSGYKVLYDRLGLHLYYKYDYYNTIKIKEDLYDQYKITGYAAYDGEKPIFTPSSFGFTFNKQMQSIIEKYYKSSMSGNEPNYIPYTNLMKKMPNSRSEIEFSSISKGQQTHSFWLPGSLSAITQYDTSAIPITITKILLNGYKSECFIYILVNKGEEVPSPDWTVHDFHYDFVYVEPYRQKNNWKGGPSTFDDCLNGTPIGNAGDKPKEEKNEDDKENIKSAAIESKEVKANNPTAFVPDYNEIAQLKSKIISNLNNNLKDKTVIYGTQTMKIYDFNTSIEGDFLTITYTGSLSNHDKYGYSPDTHITPATTTHKINLINCYGASKDGTSKDFGGPYLQFSADNITATKTQKIETATGKVLAEQDRTLTDLSNFMGYNYGENDINLKELKETIRKLQSILFKIDYYRKNPK